MIATSPQHRREPEDTFQGARICRAITRRHARTFYLASHFLPRETREHAYAIYGFCRWADDAVDCAQDGKDAERRLDFVRETLDRAYESNEIPSTVAAFQRTIRDREIPRALFEELLLGMRMDLTTFRYANFPALDCYCYRVAGVVGLMMTHVFGFRDPRCLPQAEALGRAMQLTNILRDIGEDHTLGRIYLPQNELHDFGVTELRLAAGLIDDPFRDFMAFQIRRARHEYQVAEQGICDLIGTRHRLTVRVMGRLYGDILRSIERRDYDVFRGRARVGRVRKIRLLLDCQTQSLTDQMGRFWSEC